MCLEITYVSVVYPDGLWPIDTEVKSQDVTLFPHWYNWICLMVALKFLPSQLILGRINLRNALDVIEQRCQHCGSCCFSEKTRVCGGILPGMARKKIINMLLAFSSLSWVMPVTLFVPLQYMNHFLSTVIYYVIMNGTT